MISTRGAWFVVLAVGLAAGVVACTGAEPFRASSSIATPDGSADLQVVVGDDAGAVGGAMIGTGVGIESGTGGSTTGSGGAAGAGGAGGAAGATGSGGMIASGGAGGAAGAAGATGSGGMIAAGGAGGAAGSGGMIGSGGAGGTAAVDGCNRGQWTASASKPCDTAACASIAPQLKEAHYAIDGNSTMTGYSSGRPQGSAGPEAFTVTFPAPISATGIHLFTGSANGGPASYRVEYATNGTTFNPFNPPVTGNGSEDLSIPIPRTTMNALRVTQTGTKATAWWSIHDFALLGCTK